MTAQFIKDYTRKQSKSQADKCCAIDLAFSGACYSSERFSSQLDTRVKRSDYYIGAVSQGQNEATGVRPPDLNSEPHRDCPCLYAGAEVKVAGVVWGG